MERIEIPAKIYFKANDGKEFTKEADCVRYEYLLNKYMTTDRHKTCEDGEGNIHHFFFACNREDMIDICDWSMFLLGYRPRFTDSALPKWEAWERGWLWLPYDDAYSGFPAPELGTVTDFIELQKDSIKAYKSALTDAEQIRNTPGPRI
jgi:hypothetical protein